jgi:hypothetical protein
MRATASLTLLAVAAAMTGSACSGGDSTATQTSDAGGGRVPDGNAGESAGGSASDAASGGTAGSSGSGGSGESGESGGTGGAPSGGTGGTGGSSGSGGSGGTGGTTEPPPLLDRPGCFTINTPGDIETHPFGDVGTETPSLWIRFRLSTGPWRHDVFDRDVLNHNLFGLFRNDNQNFRRYLLGLGAQVSPPLSSLNPQALFFSRLELAQGYTTYKTLRKSFAWKTGEDYDVEVHLDAAASSQLLNIFQDGAKLLTVQGALEYLDPSLTASGFKIELGAPETEHRDVSPVGWAICDLRVTTE